MFRFVLSHVAQFLADLDREAPCAGGILVALSGGSDSVALLRALLECTRGAKRRIEAAHLHHGSRGEEADEDERFCAALCERLGVPLRTARWEHGHRRVRETHGGAAVPTAGVEPAASQPVRGTQPASLGRPAGFEAAARRARYALLHEVAVARGLRYVAVGHTADDQAETILFRILRGTGLRGLAGMRPRRPLVMTRTTEPRLGGARGSDGPPEGGHDERFRELGAPPEAGTDEPGPPEGGHYEPVVLIRPLLACSRAEVLDYLGRLDQPYRSDRSNLDARYARNRLRHDLLPRLEREYNPRVREALVRLGRLAGEAHAVIARQARRLLRRALVRRTADRCLLDGAALAGRPRHVLAELFLVLWRRQQWPMVSLDARALDRLVALALAEGGAYSLPGAIQARRRGRLVVLERSSASRRTRRG